MLEIEFTRKGLKLYNAIRVLLRDGNIYMNAEDVILDLINWEFQVYKESWLIPVGLEYIVTKDGLTVDNSFPKYDYSHLETIILLAKADKSEPYIDCFSPRELRTLTDYSFYQQEIMDEVFRIKRELINNDGESSIPIYPWWFIKDTEEWARAMRDYYEFRSSDMFLPEHKKYIVDVKQRIN